MERQAGQSCLPLSIRRKSMQFAATHPLNKIRRVQIYNNIKRYRETELDKILQETDRKSVV